MTRGRQLLGVAFFGYLGVLAYVLLAPTSDAPSSGVARLTSWFTAHGLSPSLVTFDRIEFAMNVAMMVPVSVLGTALIPSWSWRDWTAYGLLAAVLVEASQALLLPARDPSYRDVVANAAGVMLGAIPIRLFRPIIS